MKEYLKKFRSLDIKTKKHISSTFLGNFRSVFKGNGLTFSDFKLREEGEDTSRIDWLVSAREGKLLVRKMEEERELSIMFLVDFHSWMEFWFGRTKKDVLLESFFLLALSAISEKDRISTYVFWWNTAHFSPFSKTKNALFEVFYAFEGYQKSQRNTFFTDAVEFTQKLRLKRSLIFVFTDSLEIDEAMIKKLSLNNEVVFVSIFHSFENTLVHDGIVDINVCGDIWEFLNIDLNNEVLRQQFVELRAQKIKLFQDRLHSYGVHSLVLTEKDDVFKKFYSFLQNRVQIYS